MRYCPECGTEVDPAAKFCPECGSGLPQRREPESGTDIADDPVTAGGDPEPARSPEDPESPPTAPPPTAPPPDDVDDDDEGLLFFAIGYPSRNGIAPPIIGGVLFLLFFLIVPLFLAVGYFVRVAGAAASREQHPPGFEDWAGMLKDGVVIFLLFVPIFIVYAILIVGAIEVHIGLYFVVALLGGYLFPAIFVNFAAERRWQSAYDISAIGELLTDSTYLLGFVLYIFVINGIGAIVVMVLLFLSLFTIVGWIIIWPIIFFYWYAIDAALWGRVYAKVHDESAQPAS